MRVAVEANVQDDTVKRYEWGMAMKPSSIERIEGALDRLELARFKRGTAA